MIPPVALLALTASTAAHRSSFCRCELRRMSLVVRWILTDWSREMTPSPEHEHEHDRPRGRERGRGRGETAGVRIVLTLETQTHGERPFG